MEMSTRTHVLCSCTCSDEKMRAVLADKQCVRGESMNEILRKRPSYTLADHKADLRHTAEHLYGNTVKQERNQSQMKRHLDVASCSTWRMSVAAGNASYSSALYRGLLRRPHAGVHCVRVAFIVYYPSFTPRILVWPAVLSFIQTVHWIGLHAQPCLLWGASFLPRTQLDFIQVCQVVGSWLAAFVYHSALFRSYGRAFQTCVALWDII